MLHSGTYGCLTVLLFIEIERGRRPAVEQTIVNHQFQATSISGGSYSLDRLHTLCRRGQVERRRPYRSLLRPIYNLPRRLYRPHHLNLSISWPLVCKVSVYLRRRGRPDRRSRAEALAPLSDLSRRRSWMWYGSRACEENALYTTCSVCLWCCLCRLEIELANFHM